MLILACVVGYMLVGLIMCVVLTLVHGYVAEDQDVLFVLFGWPLAVPISLTFWAVDVARRYKEGRRG